MWTLLLSCALAAPTPERRVQRALPDCEKVDAAVPDAVPILRELAGTSLELKVRERAAACMLEHPEDARVEEAIADWMGDAAHAPLVALVLARLDHLPAPVAISAASAGLRGPHAPVVAPAVQASEIPLVRATLFHDAD